LPEKLIRIFIAVDVPQKIGKIASDLKPKVGANPSAVKWVMEDNIHLTLRFIGPTPPGELQKINELLSDIGRRHTDFDLTISGVGCFPKKERPRVLWLGVNGEVDALTSLVGEINSGMDQLGYPDDERDYFPHVTIGRIRYPQKVTPDLTEYLNAKYVPVEITVTKVRLYRTDTLPSGAVHSLLGTHQLA
tara:strand:- start:850 stop:1419 length:570 start_codon:yes stop_codon:yes gene_type:complete